jgi:Family of unknown function (DUF5946)
MADEDLYNDMAYYTLAHSSPSFLHQHVVDAFTAQHADESTKPIAIVFALIGLYLFLEKDFSGRQVQRAHMQLAKRRKDWPRLGIPQEVGSVSIAEALAAEPGPARDAKIREWCVSVWDAWGESRNQIVDLVKKELDIG